LQIEFFGNYFLFNKTVGGLATVYEINFTVINKKSMEFRILINLDDFQTELLSLNPADFISVDWGSQVRLRILFNVTKDGGFGLLGPAYADSMIYQLELKGYPIKSGSFLKEEGNIGRHYALIDTKLLESGENYIIIVSAYKSGFTIPTDLILQLDVLKNELELNQSENDDTTQSVYWMESVDMTVTPFGKNYEIFTIEDNIFLDFDNTFEFTIPDISNEWNLSRIIFNIYNVTFGVDELDINLNITDDFGVKYIFNSSNSDYYYYSPTAINGTWNNLEIIFNKGSKLDNNAFNFKIEGTLSSPIDIVADIYFIRDVIQIQYSKFNISDSISVLTNQEGWVIKNITFDIYNCYDISSWTKLNLSNLTNLNITTNEGNKYSLNYGDSDGIGILTIDDRIIYPLDNQFLFIVESGVNIIFDVLISIEFIQEFYKNQFLESINITQINKDMNLGGMFRIDIDEQSWTDNSACLWIKGIKIGSNYVLPSELEMNITIGGIKYSVSDYAQGQGTLSLIDINRNELYYAFVETNQPANFTLSYQIIYSRVVFYAIEGAISYIIIEKPNIYGTVLYNAELGCYIQTIDTSLLDVDEYTIRFTFTKAHYESVIKDLELNVLSRLTLINGESEFYRSIENIYIEDEVYFIIKYTDAITGANITELKTHFYIWEQYATNGSVIAEGQGILNATADNSYVLDFNTKTKPFGDYLLIVTLDKDNYDYKNAIILLTIEKRELSYTLSDNFKNQQITVLKGGSIHIELNLTDPTREGFPLLNATVVMTIGNVPYYFYTTRNGTYRLDFGTSNINTFFAPRTLRGVINISKENYISEEFSINILIKMEEIFPGVPTFYFLLIIIIVVAFAGSLVGYRIFKYTQIPTFIKKVRSMKKAIDGDKVISDSLLYRDKEIFIGEIIKDKWEKIGLSLEEILAIKIEKERKVIKIKRKISDVIRQHDQKPKGLLLMKWDEKIGTEILVKYPEDLKVSEKTLMQVYSTHEYTGEKGIITLMAETLNILSYYIGPEEGYYLLLFLNIDDDPDVYETGMPDILRTILENLKDDSYLQLIPLLFQRLSVYPSLNDEEILALHYQNEIKRIIINILREEGVITKSELMIWLKDRHSGGFFDLDAILNDLIKMNIIKVSSIKGFPSELVFLINDIFILRLPPVKLLEDPLNYGLPSQFIKEYPNDIKKFFREYRPIEEDNIKITEILTHPQVYETLRLLRTAIVTKQDLEKLRKKGVEDIYGVLKILWDNNMIKVYHDEKNNEYYALLSDIYIDFIFPKYLLKTVKTAYEQKSKLNKVLVEYLNTLEDAYYDLKSKEKQ